jgi:hypothetical protein
MGHLVEDTDVDSCLWNHMDRHFMQLESQNGWGGWEVPEKELEF